MFNRYILLIINKFVGGKVGEWNSMGGAFKPPPL